MPDFAVSDQKPDIERKEVGLSDLIERTRETPAVKAAAKIAKLGDQEPLYAVSALLTGVGVGLGRPDLVRAGLRMAAAVAAADLLKSGAKRLVARSRPQTVIDKDRYISDAGVEHGKAEQSFPSGHVACTLAAGVALTRIEPRLAPGVALVVTALGVTRVLQGQHWPSDVAAGVGVGLAAEALTAAVFDRVEPALVPFAHVIPDSARALIRDRNKRRRL